MKSLVDHGYSGIDDGTKVHHFLEGIKSTELEAAANVVWANQRRKDFDVTVPYLGQMVTMKGYDMQFICISKTRD